MEAGKVALVLMIFLALWSLEVVFFGELLRVHGTDSKPAKDYWAVVTLPSLEVFLN